METLKKVLNFIETYHLISPDSRLIVGVSGGIDSVVLLHILRKLNYDCVVAHCNFHLRVAESDRDEKFVADLAKKYNLTYRNIDFDTLNYAKHHKVSIEMAARELRYTWFGQLMKEVGAESIAVAHHADDSIETVLMNLVRGTGLKGLTGIKPHSGDVIRPLINCTREELEKYAQKNGLNYVFDSSNASPDYLRNRFRNEIIPLLAEINPSIHQTLFETINRLNGTWKIYEKNIREITQEITIIKDNHLYISIEKLKLQADIFSILYEILQHYQFNNDTVEIICKSLDNNPGLLFFSETHCLLKDREHLIITENANNYESGAQLTPETIEIQSPVSLRILKKPYDKQFKISKEPNCVHIDADKVKFPLTLRRWQAGDTFCPFGMYQHKKISDFFIDEKLNRFQKDKTWILVSDDNQVAWILGLRLDNRFRITENTKNILEISYKEILQPDTPEKIRI